VGLRPAAKMLVNQWACAQPLKCSWFTIQKCFAAFPTRGAEAVTLAIANPLLAA